MKRRGSTLHSTHRTPRVLAEVVMPGPSAFCVGLLGRKEDGNNFVTVGNDYQELVSGVITDIVGGLIGSFNPVMDYDGGSLGGFAVHGITALNQGIDIYNNLLTLFPQDNYSSLTDTIPFVPGDDPVLSFLLALGKIVAASDLSPLDSVAMA